MSVTLDSNLAEDLIKFKMQSSKTTIENILKSWNQDNAEDFVQNVKNGKIPDGEMDAITIRQLLNELNKLNSLLATVIKK